MECTENLISEYSKRIYGFAYSKTHNYHDAQDLSQTILTVLCEMDFSERAIADMNSYIYRVCQYTWSNYLRKNKRHWEGMRYIDEIKAVVSDEDIENELIQKELFKQLRREIMYLGKTKRDATVLFYYDSKSGDEIAEILEIPASTVRWHLSESKKILKERIDMTDNIYVPKRLEVGFSGSAYTGALDGLRKDLLIQNICIMCHKKALPIEEIASNIGVAAAYIEDKLETLLYMNYIKKVGANKYQTNFYIKDEKFIAAQNKFGYERFPKIAEAIITELKAKLAQICSIGFCGCDFSENFLLWALTAMTAHELFKKMMANEGYDIIPPARGDGSSMWIQASYAENDMFKNVDSLDTDLLEYIKEAHGAGAKFSGGRDYMMLQFDPKTFVPYRNDDSDVQKLFRLWTLIKQNSDITSDDKEMISFLIEKGYAETKDGHPVLLIPYLTSDEKAKLDEIIDAIVAQVSVNMTSNLYADHKKHVMKLFPNYVSDDEKEFITSHFYEPLAVTWLCLKNGKLTEPTDNEKKRICTIMWDYTV